MDKQLSLIEEHDKVLMKAKSYWCDEIQKELYPNFLETDCVSGLQCSYDLLRLFQKDLRKYKKKKKWWCKWN